MKLAIYSDLHLEHSVFEPPGDLDADLIVLAGDIHAPGHNTPKWARRPSIFGDKLVVYVAGNHEFYGSEYLAQKRLIAKESERWGIHALDARAVVIDGVRFLGCTLWTDFELGIVQPDGKLRTDKAWSMGTSEQFMNDYALIKLKLRLDGPSGERKRLLRTVDTLAFHRRERAWLEEELARSFDGPTVVVTHHAPHRLSLAAEYAMDEISGAYVNELPASFFEVPVLWIHGHTHTSFDYRVGNCRVVCNPRGYPERWNDRHENEAFDARGLGIEVQGRRA